MKKYIVINTPYGRTIWTKDLMIIPGVKIHLLDPLIADRVIALLGDFNPNECVFPEKINEYIGEYSLTRSETVYNLIYLAMHEVTRPHAVITGGDSADLLY